MSDALVPLSNLRRVLVWPGQDLRRLLRKMGFETVKDEDGRLWLSREDAKALGTEALKRGAVRKSRTE